MWGQLVRDAGEPYRFVPRTRQVRQTIRSLFPVVLIDDYAAAFVSSGLVDRSFTEPVPSPAHERATWMHRSLTALEGCEVVLLDPDTGIARGKVDVRYVSATEVEMVARRAHGHHLPTLIARAR